MTEAPKQLRLNNMDSTRKTIARIIRYLQTAPDEELPRYRLINTYINSLIQASRADIEQRLEILEGYVSEHKNS